MDCTLSVQIHRPSASTQAGHQARSSYLTETLLYPFLIYISTRMPDQSDPTSRSHPPNHISTAGSRTPLTVSTWTKLIPRASASVQRVRSAGSRHLYASNTIGDEPESLGPCKRPTSVSSKAPNDAVL
ncbi:hypothetical protein AG1IA_03285 [Rhizoctonia solani AG-1 IA]|uniref:Uncharacterized protein n=1 Tax=Thanatephorus cucumeris (strain AG1-IA) TaxID=983506 RepID=L8WX51_THACA|nr:hypothetical protein AG1IA_03285 [Rhizoctonia solani AG-1 IA]